MMMGTTFDIYSSGRHKNAIVSWQENDYLVHASDSPLSDIPCKEQWRRKLCCGKWKLACMGALEEENMHVASTHVAESVGVARTSSYEVML